MKIRIKGNSLRYRLTISDVYALSHQGYLQEKTDFGKTELVYVIQRTEKNELSVFFTENVICLEMPASMIGELNNPASVGFEARQEELLLSVEKDFTCLENTRGEDQSDNYPNPLAEKL